MLSKMLCFTWQLGRGHGEGSSGPRKSEGRGLFASVASAVAEKGNRLSGVKSTGKSALPTAQTVAPIAQPSTPAPAAPSAGSDSAALASLLSQVPLTWFH